MDGDGLTGVRFFFFFFRFLRVGVGSDKLGAVGLGSREGVGSREGMGSREGGTSPLSKLLVGVDGLGRVCGLGAATRARTAASIG